MGSLEKDKVGCTAPPDDLLRTAGNKLIDVMLHGPGLVRRHEKTDDHSLRRFPGENEMESDVRLSHPTKSESQRLYSGVCRGQLEQDKIR